MLEDQCLHPIVIPHDAARAEIEAAVAEDAPDNVVDRASAQAIKPPAPTQYLKVMAVILSTICKAYLDSVAAINPVGAKELSGTNIETET